MVLTKAHNLSCLSIITIGLVVFSWMSAGCNTSTPTIAPSPIPTEFRVSLPPAPDGFGQEAEHILFFSGDGRSYDLYVMNLDGSQITLVDGSAAYEQFPSWSPTRNQVAFVSNHLNVGKRYLHIYDFDTGELRQLTDENTKAWSPVWSPDGDRLAFVTDVDGDQEIYLIDADGANLVNLTSNPDGFDGAPAWSPDGEWILFVSDREAVEDYYQDDIYKIRPDGADLTRLTDHPEEDTAPSWSLDGTQIAFVREMPESYEIFVMDADGANQRRLTDNLAYDWSPTWSPDGSRILFTSTRDAEDGLSYQIYVMNTDGANQTRLTSNDADNILPIWWP